ncbi:MAG: multicopper oxidase domain-containing protein, partial [Candidatus Hydrogenedentes bacterium]|nr:multicopper oxidase domain-containing protein [Candidatus Hydrogenedentota bacterium]
MAGLAVPALSGCPWRPRVMGPELSVPEEWVSVAGVLEAELRVQLAATEIGDRTITTRTYNGTISGPTLRTRPGDTLRLTLMNELPGNPDSDPADINIPHHPNTTNLHTHGLHVSPAGNSDNILVEVLPGAQFAYEIVIPADHPAGTFWYHPHNHGSAATQVLGGMAGALIIEGEIDEMPEIAAAQDVLMIFQELRVDNAGHTLLLEADMFMSNFEHMFPGHRLATINGLPAPVVRMQPGEVQRWRLVNAKATENLLFELEGHQLLLIAWDGITLATPVSLNSLDLAPGNRADVLVRAGVAGTFDLMSTGTGHMGMKQHAETLGYVVVEGASVAMGLPDTLPAPASLIDIAPEEIVRAREVELSQAAPTNAFPFPRFQMDGQLFDPERIDHEAALGDVEEWTIRNRSNMAHPIHLHSTPFQVVQVNGVDLLTPRWADTVDVARSGTVKLRVRLSDFAGIRPVHCHILT